MIFITVGAQIPLDRLLRCVDCWAASCDAVVIAHIDITDWRPTHVDWTVMLDPAEYRRQLFETDAVLTYGGMDMILTALEFDKS